MTRAELNESYFEWLCCLVENEEYSGGRSYTKLFRYLHETEFIYSIPMDANRFEDGVDLRYRFAYEHGHDNRIVALYLDDRACSVLEMMAALSLKCEEHIMYDPELGDRTGEWFWGMFKSMKLDSMDDTHFDEEYVKQTVAKCLERRYTKNGKGGFFTIPKCPCDLRTTDIWRQLCWYMEYSCKNERR